MAICNNTPPEIGSVDAKSLCDDDLPKSACRIIPKAMQQADHRRYVGVLEAACVADVNVTQAL